MTFERPLGAEWHYSRLGGGLSDHVREGLRKSPAHEQWGQAQRGQRSRLPEPPRSEAFLHWQEVRSQWVFGSPTKWYVFWAGDGASE